MQFVVLIPLLFKNKKEKKLHFPGILSCTSSTLREKSEKFCGCGSQAGLLVVVGEERRRRVKAWAG